MNQKFIALFDKVVIARSPPGDEAILRSLGALTHEIASLRSQ
jgi:hypothetical protein